MAKITGWGRVVLGAAALFLFGDLVTQVLLAKAVIPPLAVFAVLFVLAVVVWWFLPRIGSIVTGVVALLALFGSLPFVIEDMAHPASFGSFMATGFMTVGGLLGIAAAVAAIVRAGPQRSVVALAGGAALVVVVAAVAVVGAATASDDQPQDSDVRLGAKDIEWRPDVVRVQRGRAVFVDNGDFVHHTFTVQRTDIDVDVPAGRERRVTIDLPRGNYRFFCDVPGHEDMEGSLRVGG